MAAASASDQGVDLDQARHVGVEAARAAGELLRQRVDSIREVRHKSAIDIVTDVDVLSEHEVSSILLRAFPNHSLLGEEGGAREGDPRFRWIVDPLDGTTNYAHGFPFFCVSIGLEVDEVLRLGIVYAPILDELYVAQAGRGTTLNGEAVQVSVIDDLSQALLATGFPYEREELPRAVRSFEALSLRSQAVRRAGSAALDLCNVACGRFDGYWEHRVKAWDVAAGAVLVLEAGGTLSTTNGSPWNVNANQVAASNGLIHHALADVLAAL